MPTNYNQVYEILMSPDLQCGRRQSHGLDLNWSKLIFQLKSNKHRIKMGNQKHTVQIRETKTNEVEEKRRNY